MDPTLRQLRGQIGSRIVGNEEAIEHILICLIARGHLLLESPPGLGKTEICKSLAESVDMGFKRIQCTPDLTPQDIIGQSRTDTETGMRTLDKGPLFTNILLVDEINRAQPKTQSAFLEAMAEETVTSYGRSYRLPEPFMVLATQNPVEYDGTYRLPEAQQDRFLLKSHMTYLEGEDEKSAIKASMSRRKVKRLCTSQDVIAMQRHAAETVSVEDRTMDYIISLVSATRHRNEVMVGASTRAAVLYTQAAKARAYMAGRTEACSDDVKALAHPVLRHRLLMNPDAKNFGYTSDDLIDDILRKTKSGGE
ncbi:MAG: MoxR family ATPase [Candidatus Altiarchaeota archaeon]